MVRWLKWSSSVVVSGFTGWAVGTYTAERKHFRDELKETQLLSQDPKVSKYIDQLKQQGYTVQAVKSSFFLELHRQYMFSRSVLSRQGRLHPEGPITLQHAATGNQAFIFHVGKELATKESFPAACTTMFDEGLATSAFPKLPNKIGVTGILKLSPVMGLPPSDGLVVLHARPTQAKGRKSEAEGELVGLSSGKVLGNGSVLMIEPWWGKYISVFT